MAIREKIATGFEKAGDAFAKLGEKIQKKTIFKLGEIEDYRMRSLRKIDIKEIRREYSRLRSIARKRLIRIGESEFRESRSYKQNKDHYPPLKEFKSDRQIRERLYDLARFLNAKEGSLTGLKEARAARLESLRNNGYDFITEENYFEFGEFMETYRDQKLDEIYDSESAVELFERLSEQNVSAETIKEKMESWLKAISEQPEAIPIVQAKARDEPKTSEDLRRMLGLL